jgi:hypothetical protein
MFESYGAVTPAGHVLVRGCGYVDHADHIVGPEPEVLGLPVFRGTFIPPHENVNCRPATDGSTRARQDPIGEHSRRVVTWAGRG